MAKLRLTLVKSIIGRTESQIATVKALGLNKIGTTVEHEDNVQIRGMISKVNFMVKVEEI